MSAFDAASNLLNAITNPMARCRDPKIADGSARFSRGFQSHLSFVVKVPAGEPGRAMDFLLSPNISSPFCWRRCGTYWTDFNECGFCLLDNDLTLRVTPYNPFSFYAPFSWKADVFGQAYGLPEKDQKFSAVHTFVELKWRCVSGGVRFKVLTPKVALQIGAKYIQEQGSGFNYSIVKEKGELWFNDINVMQSGYLVHDMDPFVAPGFNNLFPRDQGGRERASANDYQTFGGDEVGDYEFLLRPTHTPGSQHWQNISKRWNTNGYIDPTRIGLPLTSNVDATRPDHGFVDPNFDPLLVRFLNWNSNSGYEVLVTVCMNWELRYGDTTANNADPDQSDTAFKVMTNTPSSVPSTVTELYDSMKSLHPGRKIR